MPKFFLFLLSMPLFLQQSSSVHMHKRVIVVTLFVCLSVCRSVVDLEDDGLLARPIDTNLNRTPI